MDESILRLNKQKQGRKEKKEKEKGKADKQMEKSGNKIEKWTEN